jgi:SAM-dependent methyltransferase
MTATTKELVAPDGSPVDVFSTFPPGRAPELISDAAGPGASILELGCGAGRITAELVRRGHPVTAVDESAEMLARVTGARTIHSRIEDLDLRPERFDLVVLPSYLINKPDEHQRERFLATCRRHGDRLLVQRYEPTWLRDLEPVDSEEDGYGFAISDVERCGELTTFTMTYSHDGRTWSQRVTARPVEIEAEWLDEWKTWGLITW